VVGYILIQTCDDMKSVVDVNEAYTSCTCGGTIEYGMSWLYTWLYMQLRIIMYIYYKK
jgi:hypothetical protein